MKSYELKYGAYGMYLAEDGHVVDDNFVNFVYPKEQVDAAITELKDRIHELESIPHTDNSAVIERLSNENERLVNCCKEYDSRQRIDERIKFNGAKQLRATKHALWLARANRAHAEWAHWATIWFCNTSELLFLNINKSSVLQEPYRCTTKRNAAIWRNMWWEIERKCRAKAEECK